MKNVALKKPHIPGIGQAMKPKPPERPETIYPKLLRQLKEVLGEDLLGLAVFGSAAGERYIKGRSDINLMILMADGAGHRLGRLMDFYQHWAPAKVAVPLAVTLNYLATSLDVFPIEFLVMSAEHTCLFGQDPLADLQIKPADLRLQLERELKAKLMAMRSRFIASGGKKEELKGLIKEALPAFTALFKAYLQLTQDDFPNHPASVLDAMEEAGIELGAFHKMGRVKIGDLKPSAMEMTDLVEKALAELSDLSKNVDQLVIAKES
jgi:hypothetical protein